MDRLVSVLIPTFNREAYIEECIQSALAQTYRPIEIVVVDNASTDLTWHVVESLAGKHPELRIFRNPKNVGPVRNWQRCLSEAKGSLAKLLFSDDLLHPSYLERTVPFLFDDRIGFVFAAGIIGETVGSGILTHVWPRVPDVVSSRRFVVEKAYGINSPYLPVSPVAALFRTNDLRANLRTKLVHSDLTSLEEHGAGPDLLLYLLTASHYSHVAHLDDVLTFFRKHPGSITTERGSRDLNLYYQAATIDALKEHWPLRYVRRYIAATWLQELKASGKLLPFKRFIERYKLRFQLKPNISGIILFALRFLIRRFVVEPRRKKEFHLHSTWFAPSQSLTLRSKT